MKKFAVCALIALSMLLTPVAHAAGFGCGDEACHMSRQSKHDSGADKQQGGKLAQAAHDCCCSPAVHQGDPAAQSLGASVACRSAVATDTNPSSVVIGPPLEPPSLA